MIDHFVVFSKSGLVLWSQAICKLNNDPIQALIHQVLMQDRSGDKKFFFDSYCMQWTFENKLELVFVVVYQKILQLMYIEDLLERVKKVGNWCVWGEERLTYRVFARISFPSFGWRSWAKFR